MEGWRIVTVAGLFLGFFFAFYGAGKEKMLQKALQRTKSNVDEAVRKRLLQSRKNLGALKKEEGFWLWLERQLCYGGIRRRFPFLNAEVFGLLTVVGMALGFLAGAFTWGLLGGLLVSGGILMAEGAVIILGKAAEMRAVGENLMKLLDFLGNYSVTSGDVISVFGQVGKYVEEPLQSALEQCCVEAQTTGDVGLALLSMADKIEHPQFKELVRNIEVSSRYSADFSVLVAFSRRSVREYLKNCRERKNLLREAAINMVLLLGMSVFAMVTVNGLLEVSVWTIATGTIPGRIAIGIVIGIALLFGLQVYHLES